MTVTVYSKPNCPQCEWTHKQLDREAVQHNVIDVTEDEDARKLVEDTGYRQMPYVTVTDKSGKLLDSWHGLKLEKLRGLKSVA